MRTSSKGIALIQHFETCVLKAYPDPGSELGHECARQGIPLQEYTRVSNWRILNGKPWTIGWGHTGAAVHPGLEWDQATADLGLQSDLVSAEHDVDFLLKKNKVPEAKVAQNEYDALISFAYNVGPDLDGDGIAEGLGDSTLLKKYVAGDKPGCADEFPKWNKSHGQVLHGLVKRRAAERALFLGEDWLVAAESV